MPRHFSFPSHRNHCNTALRPYRSLQRASTFDDQLAEGRSSSGASTNNYSIHFVKAADCYPKCLIAYRVLLTIPVTVASAKRSFSKLKLLRHYLRSTTQERFNGLLCAPLRRTFLMILILILLLKTTYFNKALKHYILFEIIAMVGIV
jgi:hypothetical protein